MTIVENSEQRGASRIHRLIWAVVVFGLVLRTVEYLECRSLWLDESFLSLNILAKPLSELHKPLDYKQGAPLGFLVAQKLSVLAFGGSEYALRLFPFLCGAIALVAFARLSISYFTADLALIAVTLFAVTDPLIRYAAEAKQYGCDAAVNTLLLLAAMDEIRREFDTRRTLVLGGAGALAVFFSHPSVFVLGGIGLTFSVESLLRKRWDRIRPLSIVFACWVLGFALCYATSLRYLAKDTFFEEFWHKDFLPSLLDIRWLQRFWLSRYLEFVALSPRNLPLYALIVLGFVRLARVNAALLSLLLAPFGFTFAASVLHKYPLFERFLVYSIPSFVIVVAAGIAVLTDFAGRRAPAAGYGLAVALLVYPVAHGAATLWTPRTIQEIKPVLAHIQAHKEPGDIIYVGQLAAYPFKYYAPRYGFNADFDLPQTYVDPLLGQKYADGLKRRYDKAGFNPIVLGYCSYFTTTAESDLVADVKPLLGAPRVWVLISHGGGGGASDIQQRITTMLDAAGARLDTFERPGLWGGSAAYLYDLSRAQPAAGG
jgi:hypothetical protein